MKKVLWSAAVALMILTLTGCAGTTAGPALAEDRPPEIMVENVPESPAPVEKEQVAFSTGNLPLAEDNEKNEGTDSSTEPVPPAKPTPTPAPQEPSTPKAAPVPVQEIVTVEPAVQEKAEENSSPAPNVTPEPEITQPPATPVEPEPPAEPVSPVSSEPPEPEFSIDY